MRGSASVNTGASEVPDGEHFSVSCIVLCFDLAHLDSGIFQAESI